MSSLAGSVDSGMFQVDEERVRGHVDEVVRSSVEETLNGLLDAEADRLCGAGRYERTADRVDTRAGSYERKLQTKAGEVSLKVPFVPGGASLAIRAGRLGNTTINTAQAIQQASNIGQTADFAVGAYQTYDAYQRGDSLGVALGGVGVGLRGLQGGIAFHRNFEISFDTRSFTLGSNGGGLGNLRITRRGNNLDPADVDNFIAGLPAKNTPRNTPADLFEIQHTGPKNFTVTGGGTKFDIDGFDGNIILDAKHVGNIKRSPFIDNSEIPPAIRDKILGQQLSELKRIKGPSSFTVVAI